MEILSNPRADRVRATARLATSAGRRKAGAFLAEGPQAVREAVRASESAASGIGVLVEDIFITPERAEREPELARARGAHTHYVTEEVLAALADTVSPQGVVARVRRPEVELTGVLGSRTLLVAVLARVQDPGNAGTIVRAADAAGADAVVSLTGSVDLFAPKVVRSTAGSLFHLPVITSVSLQELSTASAAAGLVLLAADGHGEVDLGVLQDDAAARRHGTTLKGAAKRPALSAPTAWLFGNEGQGISPEEAAASHARVSIPVYGQAESLNVGMAATLCLYASAQAQRGVR